MNSHPFVSEIDLHDEAGEDAVIIRPKRDPRTAETQRMILASLDDEMRANGRDLARRMRECGKHPDACCLEYFMNISKETK